ncbi:MAG: SusC/RagA family TonB-linked outer membrane protein [Reichenbachiella sp.]|uniref:SusC/RagA family TonB-linked outer membrane protein n=1 Tax=Reichenbachiella sp. TaxID=2184521 RepID=UPI0032669E2F
MLSDGDDVPLVGVNVRVNEDVLRGTVSNINGEFEIFAFEDDTLHFSFIGYDDAQYIVGNTSDITLAMEEIASTLNEVVVTAVGIKKRKNYLTHSYNRIEVREEERNHSANALNLLSSKVSGVFVNATSGSPGAAVMLRLRGNSSFFSNNAPLIVIDGFPVDNSTTSFSHDLAEGVDASNRLLDINPSDIDEIVVLKGPSASVLYGTRASNGAVIITTKQGHEGPTVVRFTTGITFDSVNKLPELQSEFAQGRPVNGVLKWRGADKNERNSWGPRISSLEFDGSPYPYDKNGRLVSKGTGNGVPARAYDNLGKFFKTGITTENHVSISGGKGGMDYYFSANRLNQNGVIPRSSFIRSSLKGTVNIKINSKVTVGSSLYYSNSQAYRVQKGSNTSGVILGLLRNSPTFDVGDGLRSDEALKNESSFVLNDGTQRAYRPNSYDSPLWSIAKNPTTDEVNRTLGGAWWKVEFTKWLSFTCKVGMDHFSESRNSAFDVYSNKPEGKVGEIIDTFSQYDHINSENFFSFDFQPTKELEVSGVLGHNYFTQRGTTDILRGTALRVPGFYDISNAGNVQATSTAQTRKIAGLYTDMNIIYKEALILNLSGRNDWSSTLPKDHSSFFYPSVGVALIISNLVKLDKIFFSYLKIRGSAGILGNDAPAFSTINYYEPTRISGDPFVRAYSFPTFNVTARELSSTASNPDLRAEKTTSLEIGVDAEIEKRVSLNVTLYQKNSVDQILPVQVTGVTGFTSWIVNSGEIRNRGIEIDMEVGLIKKELFSWVSQLNFHKNDNRVLRLYPGSESFVLGGTISTQSRLVEGEPYGVIYGSKFQRTESGRLIIGDGGYPLVDQELGVIGNPNPDWLLGVSNTLKYKNLSLNFLFDFRRGGDIWNGTQAVLDNFGVSKNTAELRNVRGYIYDGVRLNSDGTYSENDIPVDFANPELGLGSYRWQQYGLVGVGEEYVQDASWIRLRNVNLSYMISKTQFAKMPFESVTVTASAHNLLLITKYKGIDPETNLLGDSNGFGLDFFNNPNTRSFGIKMNFIF